MTYQLTVDLCERMQVDMCLFRIGCEAVSEEYLRVFINEQTLLRAQARRGKNGLSFIHGGDGSASRRSHNTGQRPTGVADGKAVLAFAG